MIWYMVLLYGLGFPSSDKLLGVYRSVLHSFDFEGEGCKPSLQMSHLRGKENTFFIFEIYIYQLQMST